MRTTDHQYEVMQIIAEGRERGIPLQITLVLVAQWFETNDIAPPSSLKAWLEGREATQPGGFPKFLH